MKIESLAIDRDKARELWRKYQEHKNHQQPYDAEIAAIYKRISQGKQVIRALESIRAAGVDEKGLPKLAIARADMFSVYFHGATDRCAFTENRWWHRSGNESRSKNIRFDWPGMKDVNGVHEAVVPLIPVHVRPNRGIANYHILWEAEWTKRYPVDPYLLRRFGGDAWLVVAAWDLTDVERAVMTGRLHAQ